MNHNLSPHDLEQLSAYLDKALSSSERSALDARLASDSGLRNELEELKATVRALRALPSLRPPRRYTLTPEMAKRLWTLPVFALPTLRYATALAAVAFVFVAVKDFNAARQFAAPAAPEAMRVASVEEPPADTTESAMEAKSAAPTESTAGLQQTSDLTATPFEDTAPSLAPEDNGGGRPGGGGGGEGGPGVGGGGAEEQPPASIAPAPATPSATEVSLLDQATASTEVAEVAPETLPAEGEVIIQTIPLEEQPSEPPANPWRPFSIGLGALALMLVTLVVLTRRST